MSELTEKLMIRMRRMRDHELPRADRDTLADAVNELERLREEVTDLSEGQERLREKVNVLTDVGQQADMEILRLREALERIAAGRKTKQARIARAALAPRDEGER